MEFKKDFENENEMLNIAKETLENSEQSEAIEPKELRDIANDFKQYAKNYKGSALSTSGFPEKNIGLIIERYANQFNSNVEDWISYIENPILLEKNTLITNLSNYSKNVKTLATNYKNIIENPNQNGMIFAKLKRFNRKAAIEQLKNLARVLFRIVEKTDAMIEKIK